MARYDGSIRINTKIDSKEASAQLMALENRIVKTSDKIAALRAKMDALKNVQIPTQEYSEISEQIQKAEIELNRLIEKQEQMQNKGKNSGTAWDRLNQKIEETKNTIQYAQGELQDLVDTGKAFTLGSDTEEFARLGQQLQYAENDLAVLNQRHDELIVRQNKASNGYKKLGDTAKKSLEKINKTQKKTNGLLSTMGSRFKSLALSLLIFNQISKAFRALAQLIKEGFSNLYEGNERFKNSVDSLKASALTLKNSLAAAFSPLVEIAIPYIQRFIEWLTNAINMIGQFIAALTGRKTYTRAIKQSASASEEAAEAAEEETEAMNKQLSPLDKLNVLTSENTKDKDKDAGADAGVGTMFEEVPIDNKILDFLQKLKDFLKPIIDYAQKLKDIFTQGFWDGLGDWEYRWDSIKNSIASIKDSLIDIFTDPAVIAAADGWAQSVAYMLGSLAGSMASIGLTIATNLLGGIAKYLEQNKGRIKEYLISMFNIWEEINYMFADLFQSIAYVFEAFASEQGQQLTANIIGIFVDAFMGITKLTSKLFRDIANIIIQPFVDNKEGLRTALEGFLGVLESVTGTIKDGIDATFDKLNEVYDVHFKPFFDSVAQGLSDLLGQFLEFWNGQVQPILDEWAADFDELWKNHMQPLLDNAVEFLGKIADLLKTLWENILQPFVSWFISNILPRILPILEALWTTVKDFFSYFADLVNDFIDICGGIIDFLIGVFSGDWDKAFQGLLDIVEGFINFLKDSIEGGIVLILDAITVFLRNISTGFSEAGQNIVQGLIDGISSFKDKVIETITDLANSIIEWFKNILGIHSPSTIMAEMGKYIIQGLLNGLKSTWGTVTAWLQSKIQWLVNQIQSILNLFGQVNTAAKRITSGSLGSAMGSVLGGGRSYTYSIIPEENPAFSALYTTPIPALARGAVIPANKEFLAVLGDQKHGTNIEAPLDTIKEAVIDAMAEVNANSGNNNNGNVTVEIPVIINGIGEIGRAVQKFDREFFKQTGRHAFI